MAEQNLTAVLLALPNPFTPMAFLPPDMAFQVTVATYVLVGSLSVLTWDIVSNLYSDVRLVMQFRFSLSMAVYLASRAFTFAYIAALVVLETSPTGHCENIQKIQALYPIAIPLTSLLFFFRVSALYNNNPYFVGIFFTSWLAVLGGSITATQGISGGPVGLTKYCINNRLESYVSLACILSFANDTLVFCATSWALMRNSYADGSLKSGLKVVVCGRYLPAFSRAVLQDGQVYYATIMSLNLVVMVLIFTPSVPLVYRSFFGVPNVVLMNVLACYVYRKIRFGLYRETTTLGLIGNTTLGKSVPSSEPRDRRRHGHSSIKFNPVEGAKSNQLTDCSLKLQATSNSHGDIGEGSIQKHKIPLEGRPVTPRDYDDGRSSMVDNIPELRCAEV